jgi:hypothetical protein
MFSGMTISVVSCGFDSDNMDFVEIEHYDVGLSISWASKARDDIKECELQWQK